MRRVRKSDGDETRKALGSFFGLLEGLDLACKVVGVHAAWIQSQGFGTFHQDDVRGHAPRLKVSDGLRFFRQRCSFMQPFLEFALASPKGVGQLGETPCAKEHEEHDDDDQDLGAADGRHVAQSGVSARSLQAFVLKPRKLVETEGALHRAILDERLCVRPLMSSHAGRRVLVQSVGFVGGLFPDPFTDPQTAFEVFLTFVSYVFNAITMAFAVMLLLFLAVLTIIGLIPNPFPWII